ISRDSVSNWLVINNDFRDSIVQIVRDSTTKWYVDNKTIQDSVFMTVKAKGDSLASDKFIDVLARDGVTKVGDSTLLKYARLKLNMPAIADSITNTQVFRDSVTRISRDSVSNWLVINNDFRDSIVQIVRDSTTKWYVDNKTIQDSVFMTVKAKGDSLASDKFIDVLARDG
ncbi:hypothetical protein QTN47_27825, partial [Danxiaibacter flavus]